MWLSLTLVLALAAADGPPPRGTLLDRVVAIVDDEPILLSDLERARALGLVEIEGDEGAVERRLLDGLIEQRLRLGEVERFGAPAVGPQEVEAQVQALRSRFDDEAAFLTSLARLGLDQEGLRRLIARQLRVLAYVEERLSARVFVDLDDVESYYREELVPELARRGTVAPPLSEVRAQIRQVLLERRLNDEIARWTAELRARARIEILLDRDPRPEPPLVERLEEPQGEPRGGAG